METLNKSKDYVLGLEKIYSEWWLELIDIPSGNVQLLKFKNKKKAKDFFRGMNIKEVKLMMDKIKIKPIPMYKPNWIK